MTGRKWTANDVADQSGRRILITGATSGIGKETARVLAGKQASVVIAARNKAKAQGVVEEIHKDFANADVSVRELDVSSLASVQAFADDFLADNDRLDVLINNAGVMMCPHAKTADGFEIQMGTNHLGHFALTGRLLPLLKGTPGSRVVAIASLVHRFGAIDLSDLNWENREYDTNKAYADSKLANLYFVYELARRLQESGGNPRVTVAHPGWTMTDLQRHSGTLRFFGTLFGQGAEMGALPTLRAGFDPDAESGDYFGPSRFFEMQGNPVKVRSNRRSHDKQIARDLWTISEELTGLHY